ncbi:MAG: hypothetical protein OJF51_004864 [Nitrospira sp.]|jgi:hypothetical protein|nr:MAG: hypothetical protein OJF51_004864 [Nitrospira sp.]
MARWRKIAVRIAKDEKFKQLSVKGKLVWFGLLTSEHLTPMGAGCIYPAMLADDLGLTEQDIELSLSQFAELGMVLVDGRLVIVKNYLLPDYNGPENPSQLVGWIEACEGLPSSNQFAVLREHLRARLNGSPKWLFSGLLDPLAQGSALGLKRLFWDRTGCEKPTGRKDQLRQVSRQVSKQVPRQQEQEQKKRRNTCSASLNECATFSQEEKNRRSNNQHADSDKLRDAISEKKRQPPSPPSRAGGQFAGPGGGRTPDEMFPIFYEAYPRHEHRLRAREVFMSRSLGVDWELLQKMLRAIEVAKRTEWNGIEKRFIPLPENWLKARGWENEYAEPKKEVTLRSVL